MSYQVDSQFTLSRDQIAVALTHGTFGSHLGVVFHSVDEGPKLIHLSWHKQLNVDTFPHPSQCWIACKVDIPPKAGAQVVAIFRGLAKKRPTSIGYGLNVLAGMGSFNLNGVYKAPRGSDGLTCSTLVTTLFREAALPLITEESWPSNDAGNLAWGKCVCCMLEASGADDAHLKAVRGSNRGMRVRPEEVAAAAAALYKSRPLSFDEASPISPSVIGTLSASCPACINIHSPFASCLSEYDAALAVISVVPKMLDEDLALPTAPSALPTASR